MSFSPIVYADRRFRVALGRLFPFLDEEGAKLMEEFIAIVEEIETHNGTFDISASYIPNK